MKNEEACGGRVRCEEETAGTYEKKKQLFLRQKSTLDTFLATGAITRAQYDKSLGDLIVKMGMQAQAGKSEQSIKELGEN